MEQFRLFRFILSLAAINQIAFSLVIPALPIIGASLGIADGLMQLTATVFLIATATFQIFIGPLSDAYGRRRILYIGMAILFIGSIIGAFSTNIYFLCLARLLQGIGAASANTLSRTILRDSYDTKDIGRITSYLVMAWTALLCLGPIIGSYIEKLTSWQGIFGALAGATLTIIWMLHTIPETLKPQLRHKPSIKKLIASYKEIFTNRNFICYGIMVFFLLGMLCAYTTASPFIFQTYLGVSPVAYSWLSALVFSGYFVGTYINSHLVRQIPITKLIFGGLSGMIATNSILLILGLTSPMNIPIILIPLVATFFCLGFVFPNCISGCILPFPHHAGAASAAYGFSAYIGGSVGSFIVAPLPETSQVPMAALMLAQALICFVVFMLIIGKNQKHTVES